MPNRIIRENILTSVPVSSLGWPEEVFYRRLMSIVDDYGRYEALPQLVRSRCYPLQTDQVRVADITRWMAACQKAGLVVLYEADGKQYLQLEKFGQQQRTGSKFPAPPTNDIKRKQLPADALVFGDGDVIEDGGEPREAADAAPPPKLPPKPTPNSPRIECPEGVDAAVWADWLTLRKAKRAPVTATVLDGARDEAAKAGMSLDAFLRVWCKRSSQGLEAAWLKRDERPGPSVTVEHNPQLDRTAEWLREQDQARARSTPPPAAILAMVSKIGRTA